jgi:phosphoribosylformylglycinamidine cyclo-ligase
MPGFYREDEYDLAGFIVGVVDRSRLIDGTTLAAGDVLIGLPSSGLHTNGYSLARRIVFDHLGLTVESMMPELGTSLGDALLEPHRSYLAPLAPLLPTGVIRGMAHITGGGITDNLPRMLPEGLAASVDRNAWRIPAIFQFLQREGRVPGADMWRTFNMGVGMILACRAADQDRLTRALTESGEAPVVIGDLVPGERGVVYR